MKYRLVIFDSDGTLADTLPWMRSTFNALADTYGFRRVEPSEYEQFRDLHGRELLKALELPLWKLPRVTSGLLAQMAEHIDKFSLFPGISDVLRGLSGAGIKLGVVSSNSRANIQQILGPENAALFDHYACRASIFGKAAKLRHVLRASATPREQAIYIGDEIRDAQAARKAGVAFGAVAWGQHRAETLRAQDPAAFFSSVEEIVTTLVG